jgi:hypothetical protein
MKCWELTSRGAIFPREEICSCNYTEISEPNLHALNICLVLWILREQKQIHLALTRNVNTNTFTDM